MMATFRIGMRVIKARGFNRGMTGVVVEIDASDDRGLGVRSDSDGRGWDSEDRESTFSAGAVIFGYPDEFEPITPSGHQPCDDTEFKESLDRLLEREVVYGR